MPMTLAYLSVPMIGVVDTIVIGQLGVAALIGGIAVGAIVLDILFTTFNFLRSGTTGLTAQAVGAADREEIVAVLARALIVAAVSSVAILVLQLPFIAASTWFMDPGPAVVDAMHDYLYVRIWETPLTLANYALLGWFVGLGRSMTVLGVQTLFAALNIVFSIWFVLGLQLGVTGVAWASVLAEAITVLAQVPIVLALAPLSQRSWRTRDLRPQRLCAPHRRQSRHHDPLLRAALRVRLLHPSGRAVRRGRPRRQCHFDALLHCRRLFPRRFRHRGGAACRSRRRRALPPRLRTRRAAHHALGARHRVWRSVSSISPPARSSST